MTSKDRVDSRPVTEAETAKVDSIVSGLREAQRANRENTDVIILLPLLPGHIEEDDPEDITLAKVISPSSCYETKDKDKARLQNMVLREILGDNAKILDIPRKEIGPTIAKEEIGSSYVNRDDLVHTIETSIEGLYYHLMFHSNGYVGIKGQTYFGSKTVMHYLSNQENPTVPFVTKQAL